MWQRSTRRVPYMFLALIFVIACPAEGQRTCRLLALYTPAASNGIVANNVRNYITAYAVNELNFIFGNSQNIGDPPIYNVQLAGIDSVNYTEVDMTTDINAVLTHTGAFVNIPTLLARYSADVVLLVANKLGYTGQTIVDYCHGTSYNCVSEVQYTYLKDLYTEAHELGHIFGCMHAPWDFNACDPAWPYSHGWGDTPTPAHPRGTWGTVMSGNDNRREFYSNPNRTYNGVPRGDAATAFNVQNFTFNSIGVDGFRTAPATVIVQNASINNQEVGDILATSSITIGNGFTVQRGGQLNLTQASGLAKRTAGPQDGRAPQTGREEPIPSVASFAIETGRYGIIVNYGLTEEADVNVMLCTLQGKMIMKREVGAKSPGRHVERIRTPKSHSCHMYVVIMKAGNMAFRQVVRTDI